MITFYPETYEADDDGIVDEMSRDCACPHALYDSTGKLVSAGHRTAAQAYECGEANADGKRWYVAKDIGGDYEIVFNPESDDLDELDSYDLTSDRQSIMGWLLEWCVGGEDEIPLVTVKEVHDDGSQPVSETPIDLTSLLCAASHGGGTERFFDVFLRPLHEREDCEWLEDDDGRILVPYHHPTGGGVYVMSKETFDRTFFWSDIKSGFENIMEERSVTK